MSKRKALGEIDTNRPISSYFGAQKSATPPIPSTSTASSSSTSVPHESQPIKSKNPGGSSDLSWFNLLASDSRLAGCKANLTAKIAHTTTSPLNGCISVVGFKENTRPVMDKRYLEIAKKLFPQTHFPPRYEAYHISMLTKSNLVPKSKPPSLPAALRQVRNKRVKTDNMDKDATWVCSHRCHNQSCINVDHLTWEPSWFNRLRDNCPGGEMCVHEPEPCLQPHRDPKDIVNWTHYVVEDEEDGRRESLNKNQYRINIMY